MRRSQRIGVGSCFEETLQQRRIARPGLQTGPGARPMHGEWVIEIRDQCDAAGVPFFFKQWGGVRKKRNGRTLEGRTWDAMPRQGLVAG
ncbi:MAG: DUF5131 family protein [Hyphomicrobium sp.]